MRKRIFELADILDLAYLNPLQYINVWEESQIEWKSYSRFFAIFAALSLSVGTIYISPPYTTGYWVSLLLSTLANAFILFLLPTLLGSLLDNFAQSKERSGKSRMMVDFIGISLSSLILYSPICIIFQAIGLQGFGGSVLAMLIVFLGFGILNSRGMKYIYDIKDRDSLRFSLISLGFAFFYPFIFNFYMTSYILNFTL
jgi:hypothetical protein